MNRLFALTALFLFLGLDASYAQTSLHKQKVDEQIDETSCASPNWLSRAAQLAESTQSDVREAVSSAIEICGDSARLSGNYVIAMKWWRRAADRGNSAAQMKLADLYDEGRGGMTSEQIVGAPRLAREWKPEQQVRIHFHKRVDDLLRNPSIRPATTGEET